MLGHITYLSSEAMDAKFDPDRHSPREIATWHHPDFTTDIHYPNSEKMTSKEVSEHNEGRNMKNYAAYMRTQVQELLTNFGKIDILWFDFSYPGEKGKGKNDWESEDLLDLIRNLAPDIMVTNRLDLPGSGNFLTPEQYQPITTMIDETGQTAVWEGCQTFSGSWGYHRDEQTWKSNRQLLWMLIDGVSKNGNLLLNVGPTGRGELDHRAQTRLQEIGKWMRYHSRSIYGCSAAPKSFPTPQDCRYTYNPKTNRLYLHIFNWPFAHLHVSGLKGKIAYAQLLNDASEVKFCDTNDVGEHDYMTPVIGEDMITFNVPTHHPPVEVPVIEIFLR
ncbi:MAG: alpha-L-fucosidase [Verrucomicrobiota bacterium]